MIGKEEQEETTGSESSLLQEHHLAGPESHTEGISQPFITCKNKTLIVSGFTAKRGLGQKMYLKYSVSLSVPLQLMERLKFIFHVEYLMPG